MTLCQAKTSYRTEYDARTAARLLLLFHNKRQRVYHCSICEAFHLSKQKKRCKRKKKKRKK